MDFNLLMICGCGLVIVALYWIVSIPSGSKPSGKDIHGRIADLIADVQSEAAKRYLREAGKALYDEPEAKQ